MGIARNVLNWYAKLSPTRGTAAPPYSHIVQIGDPVLRRKSMPVRTENIQTEQFQNTIKKLREVMDRYGAVGLAASQIGVNQRVFVMQVKKDHLRALPEATVRVRGMSEVPFKVFINPELRVMDHTKLVLPEGCESVRGFAADVGRYKAVEVSAYNTEGVMEKTFCSDWTARIVQHEMDHLDGRLYTDLMDRATLSCTCWQEVNLARGQAELPFYPTK